MLAMLAVLATACAGDGNSGLTVSDPWARPAPEVAPTAAFFLTIENNGPGAETLASASTDACRVIEIHRSAMADGVMTMQHLPDGLEIPASESVTLEPGGLHIMCIDKLVDFAAGTEIELELDFIDEDGASHSRTITASVEDR